MARRSQSTLEDVIEITSRFPWWGGVSLALISYLFLHWYAAQVMPSAKAGTDISTAALSGMLYAFASLGQYLLPGIFLIGAVISALQGFKRKKLYADTSKSNAANPLEEITWHEFEQLVGEYFRRQGYGIRETKGGADGGIDLIISKDGAKYLVQCKQWKAYKVGVKVVRELLGVMVGKGAAGGFVVTSGQFTKDAISFAQANNITLIAGNELGHFIKSQDSISHTTVQRQNKRPASNNNPVKNTQPICQKCGSKMAIKVAKRGPTAGEKFWACPGYPKCRSTLPI